MGFDNLVKVFECSLVTNSMSKMFGFSTVSSSWVNILDSVISVNKLEVVFGWMFLFSFFKNNSWCSLVLVGSGIFLLS